MQKHLRTLPVRQQIHRRSFLQSDFDRKPAKNPREEIQAARPGRGRQVRAFPLKMKTAAVPSRPGATNSSPGQERARPRKRERERSKQVPLMPSPGSSVARGACRVISFESRVRPAAPPSSFFQTLRFTLVRICPAAAFLSGSRGRQIRSDRGRSGSRLIALATRNESADPTNAPSEFRFCLPLVTCPGIAGKSM